MALNKEQLILDTTALSESDNVGAYIRSSDGTLITHTNVGGKDALDVNIVNDINVAIAPGSEIKITDGTDDLAINADGSINAVVSATDLDIRDLAFATDKVDVSGSSVELGATTLAALENITVSGTVELGATTLAALETITVVATDLDIRNLSAAQDNVAIDGITAGGNALVINADGSLNVSADISVVNGSDKLEDAAHASGDVGTYVLSVREDTLAVSTSASGDYQSFKTDALGRQYSNSAAQTAAFSAKTVNTTAGGTDLVTTDLANRTKILIQNIGNKPIYIGNSGVTSATGIKVPAGASAEFEAGPQVNLFAITDSGSSDVRIMELA